MNAIKMLSFALIVVGVVGLAYGGYQYFYGTRATIGPIHVSVGNTRTLNVPAWVGAAALVLGGGLLFVGGRDRHHDR